MKKGDKVSFAGFGISAKGKLVFNGKLFGTNRKCKAVRPAVFTLRHDIDPPITEEEKKTEDRKE